MTENDIPLQKALEEQKTTKEDFERIAKITWEFLLTFLSKPGEKVIGESAEIIEESEK